MTIAFLPENQPMVDTWWFFNITTHPEPCRLFEILGDGQVVRRRLARIEQTLCERTKVSWGDRGRQISGSIVRISFN